MGDIINQFLDWVKSGVAAMIDLLPDSPFAFDVPAEVHQILGYINYFVPFRQILTIVTAWSVCVAVWYVSSLLLRWLRAIE